MSNVSISNLPSVTAAQSSSQVPAVQAGTTVYLTVDQIAKYTQTTYPITGITSITAQSPLSGGTITSSGTIGLTTSSITNSYLSTMASNTLKGNNTGSAANPTDLTVAQTMTMLGAAPLASPAFTGVPTAPTPATSDSSTTLATTAYVKAQGYGTGSVTSITAGTGLSGGTITTSGTISIATTGVSASTYGSASTVPVIAVNTQGQITSATSTSISISPSQVSGLGTMATQNANAVAITGGNINGTTIGGTTPAAATFTALTATGNANFNTIASGTWNGSTIAIAYGGTGATTASGARTNLGAAASGANSDITSLTGLTTPLAENEGGTGYGSYTTGDILYASSSSTLARLNDVATGNALISGGVGVAPSWGKIGLTTHVSGTLPVANGGTGATTLTGYLVGNGTSAVTAVATIPNAGLTNSSITIGSTSIALGASTSTLSGLTTVTVTQDPTAALQLSTKQYVDGQVASVSNTTFHASVGYATTSDLGTVTYSNGTGGVGATITNAGTQAALTIDGYTFTATDVTNGTRVLVKNQSSGLQNGIYVVTNQGSGSTNWVLTRSTDFNTVGTGPNYIETGAAAFVTGGTSNGSTSWVMNTIGTITVGSTALVWVQTSSSGNITVTAPITKTGNTIGLGTVGVANGGTGLTSLTAYAVLYAASTSSVGQISPSTTGYPLLSTGASTAPAFGQLSLTAGVTGTLPVGNGGTGTATAFTTGSVVFAGASGVYSQNNAKFFWDNTNNRLGINTATPQTQLTILSNTQTTTPTATLPAGTDVYIVGANAANTRITQDAYGTGNYPVYTGRQARGTAASPTASQSGDFLSQFTGRGYGATGFGTASTGYFAVLAAENFTDTAQGTYASVYTTPTGSNSIAEVFRFGPAGQFGIGAGTYGTSGYVLTSGGASAAPTWSQVSLTTGVTGTLPVGNGGTGLTTYAIGDLLYASGTTTLSRLADVATGNVLLSGGVGVAPSWGQVSLTTAVTGTLPVANGGTGQASALTQYGVVYGSTTSAMATTGAGTTGQVLIGNTGSAPTWSSTIPSTAGVTSFSAGTTGFTPSSGTTGAVTLAGTLATGNGGTGLTTFTAANNAIYSTSASVLTAGTLPATAGGTGQASYAVGDLLYASSTTALSRLADVATGNVLLSGGVGVAPSWGQVNLTTAVTGTLPIANGGTNSTATPTAGGVGYGTGTAHAYSAAGTSGQPLISAGSSAPAFGTLALGTANTNVSGTLTVTNGGTGAGTFTANGVIYGNTTSALGVTAAGTTGQVLIATTSSAPSWGQVSLTAGVTNTLPVGNGGTGITTTPSNGQIPIGNGTNYTAATLTAGAGIGVTNASGSVTVAGTGSTINSQTSGYTLVAGDAGKTISITTGGVTVPNSILSAGNIVTIYNNSGSSQTITQGTGVTMQWAGQSSSTTGNRTLGLYGICTIIFITSSNAVISGAGLT
jgi:hypothetical protein